ncbi:MAG: family 43 glycosylhydrolase [Bacteroidetes bacterium]|nr:family 43 glycosylhydrolase [Bacteroidota bacterium]
MRTEKYNTTQYFFVNSSAVTTMSLLLILTLMLFQGCKGDVVPDELYLIEKTVRETTGLPKENNHDPSNVIYYKDRYYIWFTQHMVTPDQLYDHFAHTRIDYITSTDGIHWDFAGTAISHGEAGDLDETGALTAYVVPWEGKYYMFYSAIPGYFRKDTVSKRGITVAVADTPDGPWLKTNRKIVWGSEDGNWDDHFNGDAHVIRYNDKWWIYFKGVGIGVKPQETMLGVAVSDSLLGPYIKHEDNPLASAHAFSTWKQGKGVAMVAGRHAAPVVYYAHDGLHFKPAGPFPNKSTGLFYPDNFSDNGANTGPEWGVDVRDLAVRELSIFEVVYGNQ